MFDYLLEVSSLALRWFHLIVGIAWIGSSFYFVWLDNSIRPPEDPDLKEKGVLGELWAMHAGGFYNPQKYVVAPKKLPETLHWFFWPSYTTFISGFLLITVLYWFQASAYMIDPAKANLSPLAAVGIGFGTLVVGWVVYDLLCRMLIERGQLVFAAVYTLFVTAVAFVLDQLLSGRAAFLHVGAMIATTMTANVAMVIIPAQRIVVTAMKAGETPDAKPGKRAKQRSVHNNYLTLPVLFAMISNHYAFTYNAPNAWAILMLLMLGSVLVRHFFNLKHKGQWRWEFPLAGATLWFIVFCVLVPKPNPVSSKMITEARPILIDKVAPIISSRCIACHSTHPTLVNAAPAGVVLETPEQIRAQASRIYTQVLKLRSMPQGNITKMTDYERATVAAWYEDGAK